MAGCGRVAVNVLVLGAAGMLGPHVVRALEGEHNLRLTDIGEAPETDHEYLQVDAGDLGQVVAAADGMDAIVNLSVLRQDPQLAFDVSARGCYNMMRAAVEHGIDRVINTGPHFTITGPSYELFDHGITGDAPSQSGTGLYALTKSLGQEICRVFTEHHDISVVTLLFYNFREADDHSWRRPGLHPVLGVLSGRGQRLQRRPRNGPGHAAVQVRGVSHPCRPAARQVQQREG